MRTNRRALVLTDEGARHPFRRSLPPHVLKAAAPPRERHWWQVRTGDLRDFLTAYCAVFLAVTTYIF